MTLVLAPTCFKRTIRKRHGLLPVQTSIVRELIGRLGKIAARVYSLIVVEDINAPAAVIDSNPGKPLSAIVAWSAVDENRTREAEAAVGTALKHNVGAVLQVVV